MCFLKRMIIRVGIIQLIKPMLVCLLISGQVSGVYAGTTLVFDDNITPSDPFPAVNPNQQTAMDPGVEFRVLQDSGFVSGGGEKSIIGQAVESVPPFFTDGGPLLPTPANWQYGTWVFNANNQLETVVNTDMAPGAQNPPGSCNNISTAAANGAPGLFRNALFLAAPFGFLAPTVGSAAATTYGVGRLASLTDTSVSVRIPVAEAQWASCAFQSLALRIASVLRSQALSLQTGILFA